MGRIFAPPTTTFLFPLFSRGVGGDFNILNDHTVAGKFSLIETGICPKDQISLAVFNRFALKDWGFIIPSLLNRPERCGPPGMN